MSAKERITKNEERLDSIILNVKELEKALDNFKKNKKNIYYLDKYYGSDNWFKDKEAFEKGKISNIKAGVLGEDTIWNLFEDIDYLLKDMNKIIKVMGKNEK